MEGDGINPLQARRAVHEFRLPLRLHERAQDEQRRIGQQRIVFISTQHPVDQRLPVATTAGRRKDVRALRDFRKPRRRAARRDLARQVPGVGDLLADLGGQCNALERIADLRQAVDPDLVVEVLQRGQHVLAPPLGHQQLGLVHDVPQAQHQARAALLEHFQRLEHLTPESQRLLVDDEDVGIEHLRRVADDRRAHLEHLLDIDVQVERRVFAVAQLDHARHADEIDPRTEIEAADDRRP